MMSALLFLLLPCMQDTAYDRLSKECGLERPDALMRQGRFLEAAVGYRNVLLVSEGRDEIRIPLSFALLGTGNVDYAGKQVRCAWILSPGFDRFRFDPATLFSSPETWRDLLKRADLNVLTPDGWIFLAYAHFLGGDLPAARISLRKYTRWRGVDECARAMDLLFRGVISVEPDTPPVAKPVGMSPGSPRSAGGRYLSSPMEMKKERNVDREK